MRPCIMSSSNEFVDPFMGLHKFRVVPTQDGEASVNKHLSLSLPHLTPAHNTRLDLVWTSVYRNWPFVIPHRRISAASIFYTKLSYCVTTERAAQRAVSWNVVNCSLLHGEKNPVLKRPQWVNDLEGHWKSSELLLIDIWLQRCLKLKLLM